MPVIEVKAIDTLFFRDGKPFNRGEDNWAEGLFPPPISVFKGALRSAYFTENPEQMNLVNDKDNDPTWNLQITKIYLKKGRHLYFPSPLDYVYRKEKKGEKELFHLNTIDGRNFNSNYLLPYIPYYNGNVESSYSLFIEKQDFEDSYRNNKYKENLVSMEISDFLEAEAKIGVGLNKQTRSSSEGRLFRVGMNRLKQGFDEDELKFKDETSFVIEYQNLDFIPKILKLGAESKTAQVIKSQLTSNEPIEEEFLTSKYFKLLLLSPTYFKSGWKPNLESILPGIELQLLSAFIGKSLSIGGWDIEEGEPKIMLKAVPAGSVYYYEITNGKMLKDVLKIIEGKKFISDMNDDNGIFEITALNFEKLKISL